MKKVVIGLSGGMDSATLLGLFLDEGAEVHCCSFYYGSKHGIWEREAAVNIVKYYQKHYRPAFLHCIDLEETFKLFSSNLLLSGGDIPEGNYDDENMKLTVVPGRNLIFASIMAGYAESIGAEKVALGVHSGDHAIYPDCRPDFVLSLAETISYSTEKKVKLVAPFLDYNKADILVLGYDGFEIQVPYHLTRTCYKDQEFACGKCGSCDERLKAFQEIGRKDPVKYQ